MTAKSEWNEIKLGDALRSRNEQLANDGTFPLYSLTIEKGVTPKSDRYNREFLVKDKNTKKYKIIYPNDLVYNPANLRWGAIAVSHCESPVLASPIYEVLAVEDNSLLTHGFLECLIRSKPMMNAYNRYAEGTLVERTAVKLETFLSLPVEVPPLPEQKKIAAILGSVDEAIASTQAVIDQTRKVKQGLLAQLLTLGEWQERFGGSSRDDIPLVSLDHVAVRGTGHTPDKEKSEYWNGGVKWVSLKDSSKLDRIYIDTTAAEISMEGIRNSSAVMHTKGAVILSRDAGVGKSAILADNMAVSQHFITWTCGQDLNPYYLYYWLQRMKPIFEMIAIGNTIKTIGMPFFRKLKIPLPGLDEQSRVANLLLSADERILLGETELQQFGELKRGLMQDLLTGRVRVKGVA